MQLIQWFCAATVGAVLFVASGFGAARPERAVAKEIGSFGELRALPAEDARRQAQDWLKSAGKTDERSQKAFQAIWNSDKPVLDKVTETLTLGDSVAAKLLAEARDPFATTPAKLPAVFQDAKLSHFYRANLTLAYARALSAQRIYEEALAALRCVKPEQVVDPAAYLFHRAVAEHALLRQADAGNSILRLLEDVPESPARYRTLAALMLVDMASWREKDLGWIARKMQNSERRLELGRGGPQTQKIQKEALAQLDSMIRQAQQQQNGHGQGHQGQGHSQAPQRQSNGTCPLGIRGNGSARAPGSGNNKADDNTQSMSPQKDSFGGNGRGPGNVDPKKFRETAEIWGKLPEKERAKAMLELTRDLPARYRHVIENYFKELAKKSDANP